MPSKIPDLGTRIGDFRLVEQIGSGGMGVVYKAIQEPLDRTVALKILGPAIGDQQGMQRFQREAQAIAKLNHPNVATVHYVGQDQEVCYMAMEYVDGHSLFEVISGLRSSKTPNETIDNLLKGLVSTEEIQSRRFDVATEAFDNEAEKEGTAEQPESHDVISQPEHIRRACELIRDAARGLQHAHDMGVIHRDIKPGNIMVTHDGVVKVIDFGLARFLEDETLTQTGHLVGTPLYMSPEQVTGRIKLDHRTDIYSLGLVLYELLTLKPAMQADSRERIFRRIINESLPPVSWENKEVSTSLESVVHKAVTRDPDQRYSQAMDFADDLQRFLNDDSVHAKPYYYSFNEDEIKARRPHGVDNACTSIIVCAILLMFLPLLTDKGGYTILFTVPVGIVLSVLSATLKEGFGWARVTAMIAPLMLVASTLIVSSYYLTPLPILGASVPTFVVWFLVC